MITVNSRKFDGTIRRSWKCDFVGRRDSLLMFVGEFDADIEHEDLGLIRKGTISYEYFWLDRWYNIFRFHEPTGELRNFYCNIAMPPQFANEVLEYVDLDIDILIDRDFRTSVLDREEYELNSRAFGYPSEIKIHVEDAIKELLEVFETHDMPSVPELFGTSDRALA